MNTNSSKTYDELSFVENKTVSFKYKSYQFQNKCDLHENNKKQGNEHSFLIII